MAQIDYDAFDREIRGIVALVKAGREEDARRLFEHVWDAFEPTLTANSSPILAFVLELSEYLNNEGAQLLGQTSRQRILNMFEWEYADDLRLACEAQR